MISPAGASRAVVPAPDEFTAARPAAAEGAGTPRAAPGAARAAAPGAVAEPATPDELAGPPEHPARNSPPASMAPPMAEAAARDGMRLVGAGLRVELDVFSMRV